MVLRTGAAVVDGGAAHGARHARGRARQPRRRPRLGQRVAQHLQNGDARFEWRSRGCLCWHFSRQHQLHPDGSRCRHTMSCCHGQPATWAKVQEETHGCEAQTGACRKQLGTSSSDTSRSGTSCTSGATILPLALYLHESEKRVFTVGDSCKHTDAAALTHAPQSACLSRPATRCSYAQGCQRLRTWQQWQRRRPAAAASTGCPARRAPAPSACGRAPTSRHLHIYAAKHNISSFHQALHTQIRSKSHNASNTGMGL